MRCEELYGAFSKVSKRCHHVAVVNETSSRICVAMSHPPAASAGVMSFVQTSRSLSFAIRYKSVGFNGLGCSNIARGSDSREGAGRPRDREGLPPAITQRHSPVLVKIEFNATLM